MALNLYVLCSIVLAVCYLILILNYLRHWNKTTIVKLPASFIPSTSISVIIPVRNEQAHIKALLKSILANDYPQSLLEIIVVDDHSTDQTVSIIEQIDAANIKVLSLSEYNLPEYFNSFKKFGISKAIEMARGEFIVTTDGDCIVPTHWLSYFAYGFEEKGKSFIAAPVNFHFSSNLLVAFQALDFMGMMVVTGANLIRNKSLLCNGANLGYSKNLFDRVDGYEGISAQASGDDVMLMNRVASKNYNELYFIKNKEATVKTEAVHTWSSFVQQRLRWGTKNSNSNDLSLKLELGIAYLLCINIFLMPIFILTGHCILIFVWIAVLGIKMIADYSLLSKAASFFEERKQLKYFTSSFFIHIVYIAYVGTLSLFKKKYIWKGREVE